MHQFGKIILALAVTCSITSAAVAQQSTAQRLASELARSAVGRLAMDPLTVDALHIGVNLISEAVALDPENIELWQTALNVAMMAENDNLKNRALERLNTLDPANETARLMRLNAALDKHQVFEERKAAYERLLTDENVPRLGEAVASRLALDLALLHQRRGEIDAFSRWLTKALAWDRANRSAAAIAAGFFRSQINDPVAVVELLVNLLIADPTDVTAQVDLAQLLLEHGAFIGANRVYSLAIRSLAKDFKSPPTGLIVDQAVCQWARGLDEQALETLSRRQTEIDMSYRLLLKRQNPELTADQLMSMFLLDQSLATVAAVIHVSRGDHDASAAVNNALLACRTAMDDLKRHAEGIPADNAAGREEVSQQLAQRHLEAAWIALWLGGPIDQAQAWLTAATDDRPLSAEAQNRFEGWLAFRQGDLARAAELLSPIAAADTTARLGLAHVLRAQNNLREAAREFLTVSRTQPGSVIGIWASARLKEIIGQAPGASEQALAMERLLASLSTQLDRAVADPSQVIGLHLSVSKETYEPYEPIIATIQVTNNWMYPIGFDRNGPIRPQLLVVPSVRSAQADRSGQLRPFIVDIGRKLHLKPRESMVVRIDLRNYWPGEAVNALAVNGALVKLRTFLNFAINADGAAVPALYGTEVEAPLIRVDGDRITRQWVEESIHMVRSTGSGGALIRRMAMFSHYIAPPPAPEATLEDRQLLETARIAFGEAFAKLDGPSQAWLLCVMPRGVSQATEGLQPTLAIARKSPDRLVTIAYLTFHAPNSQDPMFDAAKRSDDAKLQGLASALEADVRLREAASRR
jgi:tetratricopeptide (TPR) repeat protein